MSRGLQLGKKQASNKKRILLLGKKVKESFAVVVQVRIRVWPQAYLLLLGVLLYSWRGRGSSRRGCGSCGGQRGGCGNCAC